MGFIFDTILGRLRQRDIESAISLVDAAGAFASRSTYNAEAEFFVFLATDQGNLYIRIGAPGSWSDPIPLRGETGAAGATGPEGPAGQNYQAGKIPISRIVTTSSTNLTADDVGKLVLFNSAEFQFANVGKNIFQKDQYIILVQIGAGILQVSNGNDDPEELIINEENDIILKSKGQYQPLTLISIDDTPNAERFILLNATT